MFDLLLSWFASSSTCPRLAARPSHAQPPDEPVPGCGWFDSSHDLAQGTEVIELADDVTPLWLPLCRKAALAQA